MMSQLSCVMISYVQVCSARRASVWRLAVALKALRAPPPLWHHTFTCWPSVWSPPPSADHAHWPGVMPTDDIIEELSLFPIRTRCVIIIQLISCFVSRSWRALLCYRLLIAVTHMKVKVCTWGNKMLKMGDYHREEFTAAVTTVNMKITCNNQCNRLINTLSPF